jgi:hypothetical protein
MAMIVGNAKSGTGLAGAIAAAMVDIDGRYNVNLAGGDMLPNAIAKAVVEYLQANADVVGVVTTPSTGIQVGTGSLL